MADWAIDPGFHEEPTHVPSGDECEAWSRGEMCGHSDCNECGVEVALYLILDAMHKFGGLMRLAADVAHVQKKHGINVPESAVTHGDVLRVLQSRLPPEFARPGAHGRTARHAYVDGLVDGVGGVSMPATASDCYPSGPDYPAWAAAHARWCYFLGRLAPALYRLNLWLETRRHAVLAEQAQEFLDASPEDPQCV